MIFTQLTFNGFAISQFRIEEAIAVQIKEYTIIPLLVRLNLPLLYAYLNIKNISFKHYFWNTLVGIGKEEIPPSSLSLYILNGVKEREIQDGFHHPAFDFQNSSTESGFGEDFLEFDRLLVDQEGINPSNGYQTDSQKDSFKKDLITPSTTDM